MILLDIHYFICSYILVILFGIGRFAEAHMSTSVFNYISGSFPASMKEDAIRFLGLADMIAVTAGTIISALIINSDYSCTPSATDDSLVAAAS